MSDHHVVPPRARKGNRADQRSTRRNLTALAQATQQDSGTGKREIALLAASLSNISTTDDAVLEQADKYLQWLQET